MHSSDSQHWTPPTAENLDELLDRYTVVRLLGRGGMGAVYLARQTGLDRDVAIKLLPQELTADLAFVKRFKREAKAMARLDHPSIVRVFDFGRSIGGHLYFVMEYVDGCDLAQLIQKGVVEVNQALELISQLCDALAYAHAEGIVHRDIKPSNILLDRKGRLKIADFGLARPLASAAELATPPARLTASGQVMGTLEYMAPELLAGKPSDHRADIYALGVLFYELLTGDVPRGAWCPPSRVTPGASGLDEIVLRALQPKPEDRYQQAAEIKRDVTTAAQLRSVPPVRRRTPWVLLSVLALVALVLVWLAPQFAPQSPTPSQPIKVDPAPIAQPIPKPLPPQPPQTQAPPPFTPALVKPSPAPPGQPIATVTSTPQPDESIVLVQFPDSKPASLTGSWQTSPLAQGQMQNTAALHLGPTLAADGSIAWDLTEAAIDLRAHEQKHLRITAKAQWTAKSLVLSLIDSTGKRRSWRIKPEQFAEDKPRVHVHFLALATADFQNPKQGYGSTMADAGFDLSQVKTLQVQPDPHDPSAAKLDWEIHRISL